MSVSRQAVIDGRLPVGVRQRTALVIGYRHQWHFRELTEQRLHVMQVQTSVQRGDGGRWVMPEKRKVQVIVVEMNDVELRSVPKYQIHQPYMLGQRFATSRIAPEGAFARGNECCSGFGIAAGKKGNLVAQPNQFFRQKGDRKSVV